MWCFSYHCNGCWKPTNSSSFDWDVCEITLIDGDKKIEQMYWPYDSYGRVFDENMKSLIWNYEWSALEDYWMFWKWKYIMHCAECVRTNNTDYSYWSESDNNQWWSSDKFKKGRQPKTPYHKIY